MLISITNNPSLFPNDFSDRLTIRQELHTPMSSNSFFPSTEAGQIIWLTNYASKLPIHSADCGISDEEVTDTLGDI